MKAFIHWNDGTVTETKATKNGGAWMIGGDHSRAVTDLGAKISVISKGKEYWLKGNRLIFQDYSKDSTED